MPRVSISLACMICCAQRLRSLVALLLLSHPAAGQQACLDYGLANGIQCLDTAPGDCYNSAHKDVLQPITTLQCYSGATCSLDGMITCTASPPTFLPKATPAAAMLFELRSSRTSQQALGPSRVAG